MAGHVTYRRIYEEPSAQDGKRVLVDRLWPRGVSKERADLDEWLKDVAPSTDLRHWYHHDVEHFDEFRRRYIAELHDPEHQHAVEQLRDLAAHDKVTLLTATKDADHSEAAVLAQWLNQAEPHSAG
ncbi:DUF488 domain-containing protein [Streptomyces sp. NRRL S-813]|uniref:DUF488 domain-containing protein n=1 Tax=Streptomyces sp. NRRL S-813 TaxID=1463919 RepID=UPI0004C03415|nr:DUF488 family protein [Streptomyces sp. NRRL S-813]